jgi:transcriptional regulator with XRE-family HTH domain
MSDTLFAMDQQQALTALGEHVRRRRERLGMSIDEAADAGGVSPVTWSRVELGRKVRRLSYGAVDRVLNLPPGACIDFLQSGEPLPSGKRPTTDENLTEMEKALTRIEKALDARDGERQERQRRAVIEALRAIIEDSASSNGSS